MWDSTPEAIFCLAAWLSIVLLVHAYLIFPLSMMLLGFVRQRSVSTSSPSVSLIIPAFNEEVVIEEKIKNSLAIDYPNLEIIVASDGSQDRTAEICKKHKDIRLLDFEQRRGKASAVVDAVNASIGELTCLCDANVMFRPDALQRLVNKMSVDVGAVTGDVRLDSSSTSFGLAEAAYYQLERRVQQGESALGSVVGVDGGMYLVRREFVGDLPPDTVLDDFTISMYVLRSGMKVLYEPAAIADENATESAMSEYRRRTRIGRGAAQLLKRGVFPKATQPIRMGLFVSHKLLRWLSPFLLLVLLVSCVGLVSLNGAYWPLLLPWLVTGALAVLGVFVLSARKSMVIAAPFYFAFSQIAFGWGFVHGLLFSPSGVWARSERQKFVDQRPGT